MPKAPMVRALLSPVKRRMTDVLNSAHDQYRKKQRSLERWRNKRGSRRTCYLCSKTFDHFYPLFADEHASSLFEELDVIGSDLANFYCPHCLSFDRERHLFMYLDRLDFWKHFSGSVLHFAPERNLRTRIEHLTPAEYVLADLEPGSADVRSMSVTAIDFPDEYFDIVLCNHVLEHVPDDSQAIAEIFRVLKRNGRAILQTPYSAILAASFEDPNINTDELRSKIYGQKDHVRVYGLDFFSKLQRVGFVLDIKNHRETMPDIESVYHGVNGREDLILALKH